MFKNPTPTGLTILIELIGLVDNNLAILFERVGIRPQKRVIDGHLKYGYGITKDGDFYFHLPEDYYREYQRYTFNFWRNVIIVAMVIGALKLAS